MKLNNNTYNIESFDYEAHQIYLCDDIDDKMVKDLTKKLNDIVMDDRIAIKRNIDILNETMLFVDKQKFEFNLPPINIYLTSFGGWCYAGIGLYDHICEIGKEYDTQIICSGYVMSMGTIILQAANKRIARKNTTFMVHDMADYMGYKKLADIKDKVEEDERLGKVIDDILISKTKFTKDKLDKIYKEKKDFYFDAEKALEYGIIDEIIN